MRLVVQDSDTKEQKRQTLKELGRQKGVEIVAVRYSNKNETPLEATMVLSELLPKRLWKNMSEFVVRIEKDKSSRFEIWES